MFDLKFMELVNYAASNVRLDCEVEEEIFESSSDLISDLLVDNDMAPEDILIHIAAVCKVALDSLY